MEENDKMEVEFENLTKQMEIFLRKYYKDQGQFTGIVRQLIRGAILWGTSNPCEGIEILAAAQMEYIGIMKEIWEIDKEEDSDVNLN